MIEETAEDPRVTATRAIKLAVNNLRLAMEATHRAGLRYGFQFAQPDEKGQVAVQSRVWQEVIW